jgi:nucleoside-diphosphate-sugar epimerase
MMFVPISPECLQLQSQRLQTSWAGICVAVTGASGFLGQQVAKRFKEQGAKVLAFGLTPQRCELASLALGLRVYPVSLEELSQHPMWQQHSPELVLHCAAHCSPWASPLLFQQANVLGTQALLDASHQAKVRRFIHISSSSVYHCWQDNIQLTENKPMTHRFINTYAATKWQADLAVNQAGKQGMETLILRPCGILGAGERTLVPRLLQANNTIGIPRFRSEPVWTDTTHVQNLVDAIVLAATAPQVFHGETFHITDGQPIVLHDFLKQLLTAKKLPYQERFLPLAFAKALAYAGEGISALGGYRWEPPLTSYGVCLLTYSNSLSIEAAKNALLYTPKKTVEQLLQELIEDTF